MKLSKGLAGVIALAALATGCGAKHVAPQHHTTTVVVVESKSSTTPSAATRRVVSASRKPSPSKSPAPVRKAARRAHRASVTVISRYVSCPTEYQGCIDRGNLTLYHGNILAGHNYLGWQWLAEVPTGRTVRVISGQVAGTYRVFSHLRLNRQGGAFPDFRGAALVLQSCEGSGTGFSLLRRV